MNQIRDFFVIFRQKTLFFSLIVAGVVCKSGLKADLGALSSDYCYSYHFFAFSGAHGLNYLARLSQSGNAKTCQVNIDFAHKQKTFLI